MKKINKEIQLSAEAKNEIEESLIKPLMQQMIEGPPSSLETKDQQLKRLHSQLKHSLAQYEDCFKNAGRLLNAAGFTLPVVDEELTADSEEADIEESEEILPPESLQELLGLEDEQMDQILKIAVSHYSSDDFQNARDLFILLTTLDPSKSNYWMGLGMAEQMSQHYDMAGMAYAMAADLNTDDPSILLYSANCLRLMDKLSDALALLDALIEGIGDDAEWQGVKKRAQELLSEWKPQ